MSFASHPPDGAKAEKGQSISGFFQVAVYPPDPQLQRVVLLQCLRSSAWLQKAGGSLGSSEHPVHTLVSPPSGNRWFVGERWLQKAVSYPERCIHAASLVGSVLKLECCSLFSKIQMFLYLNVTLELFSALQFRVGSSTYYMAI